MSIEVNVSHRTWSRERWHFAQCPELQLIEQGKSKKECVKNLSDMIVASLEEAIASNNIKGMMRELGFSLKTLIIAQKDYYELNTKTRKKRKMLYFVALLLETTSDAPFPYKISKGSHIVMRHQSKKANIAIPIRSNQKIQPELTRNIIKKAGLTKEEFLKILENL